LASLDVCCLFLFFGLEDLGCASLDLRSTPFHCQEPYGLAPDVSKMIIAWEEDVEAAARSARVVQLLPCRRMAVSAKPHEAISSDPGRKDPAKSVLTRQRFCMFSLLLHGVSSAACV